MDCYQYSESRDGPWWSNEHHTNPGLALESARKNLNWESVWIARMLCIGASEILPTIEQIYADIDEKVSVKHGSKVASELMEYLNNYPDVFEAGVWQAVDHVLGLGSTNYGRNDNRVLVPLIKKFYLPGKDVTPDDFDLSKQENTVEAQISHKTTLSDVLGDALKSNEAEMADDRVKPQPVDFKTSYGEHLVGISFNPSGNEQVNHIKRTIADLIDYVQENGKDGRCTAICTTNLEQAAMWAVKSVTKEPRT